MVGDKQQQQFDNPWQQDAAPDPVDPWAPTPSASSPHGQPDAAAADNPWIGLPTPAKPGGYMGDMGPQTSAGMAAASGTASAAGPAAPGPDPITQDAQARQVQSALEEDGHTVKWLDSTNLTVDGRPYELGATSAVGATGQSQAMPDQPDQPDQPTSPAPAAPTAPATGNPWTPQELTESQQWANQYYSSHQIPGSYGTPDDLANGYVRQRQAGASHADAMKYMQTVLPGILGWDKYTPAAPAAPNRMDDTAILGQIAQWAQMPGADPSLANDPQYWLKAIKSRGGLGDDNRQFWQDASVGDSAFFRHPERETGGAGAGGGSGPSPQLPDWWAAAPAWMTDKPTYPDWSPSTPDYVPGSIDPTASELPGFEDVYKRLMDGGSSGDAELDALMKNILEHPESLGENDVATLKAKNAEEMAAASQAQDEDLQHFGYGAGLADSPWLAGQRSKNEWDRRTGTIGANRNIDVAAAQQRTADRIAAANLGTQYSGFQASKKAQAVQIAVTAALGKAGEQRSRTQLNESLKQAATQLGLSKDSLVMNYLEHNIDDLTKNKQIGLDFDINMKKLAEQSDEFKQTLLQRIHEMQQADDQFRANYGLAVQEFQHKKDTDAWDQAKQTYGG